MREGPAVVTNYLDGFCGASAISSLLDHMGYDIKVEQAAYLMHTTMFGTWSDATCSFLKRNKLAYDYRVTGDTAEAALFAAGYLALGCVVYLAGADHAVALTGMRAGGHFLCVDNGRPMSRTMGELHAYLGDADLHFIGIYPDGKARETWLRALPPRRAQLPSKVTPSAKRSLSKATQLPAST